MKKPILISSILSLCIGQNLSESMIISGDGVNSQADIAMNQEGVLYSVWLQNSNGYNIQFSYSDDGGSTFSEPNQVNDHLNSVIHIGNSGPKIDVWGDTIHVIWADERNGYTNSNIYYSQSVDQGETWTSSASIGQSAKFNIYPEIKVSADGHIHVIYYSYNRHSLDFDDIHYIESTDNGASFSSSVIASNFSDQEPCDCCAADIHVLENNSKILAFRNNNNNIRDMFSVSIQEGDTDWGHLTQISRDNFHINYCPSSGPSIDGFEQMTAVVYMAPYFDDTRIYLKVSHDNGSSYGDSILVDLDAETGINQDHPIVGFSPNGDTHIIWEDSRNFGDIYYGRLGNGDTVLTDLNNLTEEVDAATQKYPRMIVGSDASVYVVWTDFTNSGDIIFRSLQGNFVNIDEQVKQAKSFSLIGNYPNPFNPNTTIEIALKKREKISLQILDVQGRWIKTLVESELKQGIHHFRWSGKSHSSGSYFVKIESKSFSEIQKIVLLK